MSCKSSRVRVERFDVRESPGNRNAIVTWDCEIVIQRISSMQRPFAKYLLVTAVLAFAAFESASAGELPTFEASSFPATPVQVAVMGGAGVREQAATPTLTRNNMPASPHQLSVLTPRHTVASATNTTTVGTAHN